MHATILTISVCRRRSSCVVCEVNAERMETAPEQIIALLQNHILREKVLFVISQKGNEC